MSPSEAGGEYACVATCRPGLEGVVAEELQSLGVGAVEPLKRAVRFRASLGLLYRLNLGLRCALAVLVELRQFRASNYDLLYHQARRTNWQHWFRAGASLRIDVNGKSRELSHSRYVIHRIKDGIVDTFRKLAGERPSIAQRGADIHVVAHLDGDQVTLYLDSSGEPLFKRGYRTEHGGAPLKEDLAAGILWMSGAAERAGLVDPVCGTGTFLFEGWMLAHGVAPNKERAFAFQNWYGYDEEAEARERRELERRERWDRVYPVVGRDMDEEVVALAQSLRDRHFGESGIELASGRLQEMERTVPGGLLVANPPYGERMGGGEALAGLYKDLGWAARTSVPGGAFSLFTTNRAAARGIPMKRAWTRTLFNGQLEGLLYHYAIPDRLKNRGSGVGKRE